MHTHILAATHVAHSSPRSVRLKKKKIRFSQQSRPDCESCLKSFPLLPSNSPVFGKLAGEVAETTTYGKCEGDGGTTLSLPSTPPCSTCEWERIFSPQVEEERATKTKYVDRWDIRFDMTEHENTSDSFLLKISVELGGRICHSRALLQQHVSPKRRKRKHKHTSEGGFTQHLKYYSDTHVNRETPRRPNRNNPVNRFRSICPSENRSVSN